MSINIQGYLETIRAPWGQLFYDLVWDQLPYAGQTILDFGSGFGLTAAHLAEHNQVTAIEPNADMLAHRAPGGYCQQQGGVELLEAFPDASFDVILCHNVLEYVDDRAALLAAFARLLKPEGILSVVKHNPMGKIMSKAVFECDPEAALSLLQGDEAHSANFGVIREYDTAELAQGPFSIEKVQGIRTFFALQRNEVKTAPDWRQRMFRLERAVAEVSPFREAAFFHHVLLRKR